MPSDWDGGTITAHFYWTATGTSTNNVQWAHPGGAMAIWRRSTQTSGPSVTVSDAHASTALQMQITSATPGNHRGRHSGRR